MKMKHTNIFYSIGSYHRKYLIKAARSSILKLVPLSVNVWNLTTSLSLLWRSQIVPVGRMRLTIETPVSKAVMDSLCGNIKVKFGV